MRLWVLLLAVVGRVHAETEQQKARRTLCLKLPTLCPQASGLIDFKVIWFYNGFFVSQESDDQTANQRSSDEDPTNEQPSPRHKGAPTVTSSEPASATNIPQAPDHSQEGAAEPGVNSGETTNRFRQFITVTFLHSSLYLQFLISTNLIKSKFQETFVSQQRELLRISPGS